MLCYLVMSTCCYGLMMRRVSAMSDVLISTLYRHITSVLVFMLHPTVMPLAFADS